MKNFKISCVQIASGPNVEANLLEVGKYIDKSKILGADVVVLPENFALMAEKDSIYLDIKEEADRKALITVLGIELNGTKILFSWEKSATKSPLPE